MVEDEQAETEREMSRAHAALYPKTWMLSFFYQLLDQGAPPGVIRNCMFRASDELNTSDNPTPDVHIAGMAGQLVREAASHGLRPPDHERLHIMVDLDATEYSYDSLVVNFDEILDSMSAEAKESLRKALTERIKEHHRDGTVSEGPIKGKIHPFSGNHDESS